MKIHIASIFIASLLSGCGPAIRNPGAPLSHVPDSLLPRYEIGDIFVFDDGYVERVTDVQGELVSWETATGRLHYTGYRNFLIPRLHWENEESRGEIRINVDPALLWPLVPGSSARMTNEHTITTKLSNWTKPYDQEWRCSVGKAERLSIPAGVFDTIPVTCERNTFFSGKWMQTRVWYYAPEIGHYVRKIDELAPTKFRRYIHKQRDLAAYIPAIGGLTLSEQQEAERHFQESLEKLPSGTRSEWYNPDDTSGRSLLIQKSFSTEGGKLCREFEAEVRSHGQLRKHSGAACRDTKGWRYALARDLLHTKQAAEERK